MNLLSIFINESGSQLTSLFFYGFMASIVGVFLFIFLWNKLRIDIEFGKGFLVLNFITFFTGAFLCGFTASLPIAFDKATSPLFTELENEIKKSYKAKTENDSIINISLLHNFFRTKNSADQTLQSLLPVNSEITGPYLSGMVPGYKIITRAEKQFSGKKKISPHELRLFIQSEIRNQTLFFLPELPVFAVIFPFALLGLTVYIQYSDKKRINEIEQSKKENRICL